VTLLLSLLLLAAFFLACVFVYTDIEQIADRQRDDEW
jgi:hypothetical protein